MTLFVATLLTGLLVLLLGVPLLLNISAFNAALRAFPRSGTAAAVFFGTGALWFLYELQFLSAADFGEYKVALIVFFALIAAFAHQAAPDFLAVRGVCILVLIGAMPLLTAGFMNYSHTSIMVYKATVYIAISLAIYLGSAPFRMRDFLEWLYRAPGRARWLGGVLTAHGLVLTTIALTY